MPDAAVTPPQHVFYLHGFASSSQSTKAAFFAERLRKYGLPLHCPDFNEPDFATLTLTRMLDQLSAFCSTLSPGTITLIGSSLGGVLAILAAERMRKRITRLVLLAPAVMFAKPGHHLLTPERVDEWRRAGAMPFFHYAFGEERLLNYTFFEDSVRYDSFNAAFDQPTLIFQGLSDASVPYRTVEQFAAARKNVTLSLLDDDHQLINSLPRIWQGMESFLGLGSPV